MMDMWRKKGRGETGTWFVMVVATVFSAASAPAVADSGAQKTNIVIITSDNLGYGDVGCYGNEVMRTPQLDRLAAQSVRCTDFYTASPSCTPSRGALLTGRFPERTGLNRQLMGDENLGIGLRQSERLISDYLKEAGYVTGCFGKWNIGFAKGSRPTERGFDEFFGHASGNIDYYTHVYRMRPDMFRGTESVQVKGYSTDLFADAACDFIRCNAKRPFFVYLPFNAPHYPGFRNKKPGEPVIWQAPPEAFAPYGDSPETRDAKKRYRAVVTALDTAIGRVMDQIDSLGLTDNTLLIWFSDNGAFMRPGHGLEVASNKPLRGGGCMLYEGGIRVPCMVRWPGRIKPGTVCREALTSLDFFVMALKTAGAPMPEDRIIDGQDPTATLASKAATPHKVLYFVYQGMAAIRRGSYKLIRPEPDKPFELYDLSNDISETKDLTAEKPNLAAELKQQFEQWFTNVHQDGKARRANRKHTANDG